MAAGARKMSPSSSGTKDTTRITPPQEGDQTSNPGPPRGGMRLLRPDAHVEGEEEEEGGGGGGGGEGGQGGQGGSISGGAASAVHQKTIAGDESIKKKKKKWSIK